MNCGTSAAAAGCIQLQPSRETRSIWPQSPTEHHSMLCNATMHCAMPRNAVQWHVALCNAKKCCATPCCAVQCQEMPHHAMLCHATLHRAMAHHAMQCCRGGHKPLHCSLGTFPFMLTSHRPQTPTCFSTRSRSCSALAPAALTGAPGHLALPIGRK